VTGSPRERLALVFERLFGDTVSEAIVTRATQGHEAWDSMAHINLVLMVEQEFRITFSPEEAGMTTSFESMREIVELKLGGDRA
jgi:acyl carrier protein